MTEPILRTLICFLALTGICHCASAQQALSRAGSLVSIVPGIRDEASDSWIKTGAAITPTKNRWVIREEGVGNYSQLNSVPQNHIITVRTGESLDHIKIALHTIAGQRDVTVIVDMNIGSRFTESSWNAHTTWAANVTRALAETHGEQFPKARNTYIGHSAGTDPIAKMPNNLQDAEHHWHKTYDDIMLLSPRRGPEGADVYPKHAVLAFADGDVYANVGKGTSLPGAVLVPYNESDARAFALKGFNVLRVEDGGSHGTIGEIFQNGELQAHKEIHDLSYPDRKMVYYQAGSDRAYQMPSGSLAIGLRFGTDVQAGRITDVAHSISLLKAHEPTPGIGGISLNATATMPIDPAEIASADYRVADSRIVFNLKSGVQIKLPQIDPETTREMYDIVYVAGQKPELSIGSTRATAPDGSEVVNLQAPGKSPVHYFGGTQNKMIGLVMYRADDMLGRLAFTTMDAVHEVQAQVPKFRSLPELFPEKYATNPASGRFTGRDIRVFLTPSLVEFVRTATGIDFGELSFAVHFGRPGPAEEAFAALFEANQSAILSTQSGEEIARLIPYARAAAVMRWMRENNIPFAAGQLLNVETGGVFTPNSEGHHTYPTLSDIEVSSPTTFYGPDGPTRIVRADGSETMLQYSDGRLVRVERYDGKTLVIHRDSVGAPIAIEWPDGKSEAFVVQQDTGLSLAKHIELLVTDEGINVSMTGETLIYPIVNPEGVVINAAKEFALEGKP